jgi:CubicO group peptidase (beta-lactamase class C family)
MLLLLAAFAASSLTAQAARPHPLSDYVGRYADAHGTTVDVVAGSELFAVQDEAKYILRPAGIDTFSTNAGERIPFVRNAKGIVTGYQEAGRFHPRTAMTPSRNAVTLLRPRPPGEDSPAGYRYHIPVDLHDGIPVGDIAASSLDSAIAATIVGGVLDGTYPDVHSILLFQRGRLVMEEYFYGYTAQRQHQLRSATKSVVSALAGIAIDQGKIAGASERVLPQMRYTSYEHPDPRKSAMTLGNFLSMSSGLDCNDHSDSSPGRETVIDDAPDWVEATLDLAVINNPGSRGYYCSGGVAVVGRLIENAVHTTLPTFARQNLFRPLGIADADWTWNYNLTNADKEYSQIHLRPRDMLKLGILFADSGRWHGRQIVSRNWVAASLSEQSQVDSTSYGYFWWRPWSNVQTATGTQQVHYVAAQGNGGQKIYLLPQFDLVAVFTAGDYNSSGAPPNRIMNRIILPVLIGAYHRK